MFESEKKYDVSNPKSIEAYAKKMIGKSFGEICYEDEANQDLIMEESLYSVAHENKKRKGGLGELIEEKYFHYSCNSDSRPDFAEAGVELKVTPFKKNANGTLVAKERLVITMIDYFRVVEETFEKSHLWAKSRLILLVFYLYNKEVSDRLEYRIHFAQLFTPSQNDLIVIRADFNKIVEKVRNGKAHELSGSDTFYLEACTKASNSSIRRQQPYSDIPAKPRAFAFKNSYMTYVLNTYIVNGKSSYEPIIREPIISSFDEYVVRRISAYKGYSVEELIDIFNVDIEKKPKNLESMLAFRILGINGNFAEEFVKANIVVKTIRIEFSGRIKESMSFPTFKFKELIQESWEDSTFGNYLRETKFLFVVYKYDRDSKLRLKGCQFWNIPYDDLENEVRKVWERTINVLKEGLIVEVKNGKNYNNFPKATENRVSHVRPHAQNMNDTYELPDGRFFPKQCFWLNNTYILEQLNDELKC